MSMKSVTPASFRGSPDSPILVSIDQSSNNKAVVKVFVSHYWSPKPFKDPLDRKDLLRLILRDHSKVLHTICLFKQLKTEISFPRD